MENTDLNFKNVHLSQEAFLVDRVVANVLLDKLLLVSQTDNSA